MAAQEKGDAMKLELRNVLLQLSEFALEVDTSIASARTAIFGPSGAGKTSLLEIIAGLREITLRPDLLQRRRLSRIRPVRCRLRKIGYLPQDDSLFPHFDVRRNLLYGRPPASREPAFSLEHVTRFSRSKGCSIAMFGNCRAANASGSLLGARFCLSRDCSCSTNR